MKELIIGFGIVLLATSVVIAGSIVMDSGTYLFGPSYEDEDKSWPKRGCINDPSRMVTDYYGNIVCQRHTLKCGRCAKEDKQSKVYNSGCLTTAMYCPSYHDENGVFQKSDCNTTTCTYYCSGGHWFTDDMKEKVDE